MGFNNKNIFYGDNLDAFRDKLNSNFWGSYFNGIGDKGEIGDIGATGQPGEVGTPGNQGLTGSPASNWFFSETQPTEAVKEYDLWVDLLSSSKEIYIYVNSVWTPSGENFQSSGSFYTLPGISGPGEISTGSGISINKIPQSEYSLVINSKPLDNNNANKNSAKFLISADDSSISKRSPILSFGKTFYTEVSDMPDFSWTGTTTNYSMGITSGDNLEFLGGTGVFIDSTLSVTGASKSFVASSVIGTTFASAGTVRLDASNLGISGSNFYMDSSKVESKRGFSMTGLGVTSGGTGIDSLSSSSTGENFLFTSSWETTPSNRKRTFSVISDGSIGVVKYGALGVTGSITNNFHAYLTKQYITTPVFASTVSNFNVDNGYYDSIGGTTSVSFFGGSTISLPLYPVSTDASKRRNLSLFVNDKVTLQTYDSTGFGYTPGESFEYIVSAYNRTTGYVTLVSQFSGIFGTSYTDWTLQAKSPSGTISGLDPLSSLSSDVFLLPDPVAGFGNLIVPVNNVVFYSIEIPAEAFLDVVEKKYYVSSSVYGVGGIAITINQSRVFLVRNLITGTSSKSFTIKYIPNSDGTIVTIYLEAQDGENTYTWINEYGG